MNIRKAVSSDAEGIAGVHVDSWRTTYKHIVPDAYLKQLDYKERAAKWGGIITHGGVFVAENEQKEIVGFSSGGRERSGKYPKFSGELYAIYLLEAYQGKGAGITLVKSVVDELKGMGKDSMLVIVLEDNLSKYFYEKLGAKKIDSNRIELAGKQLNELVYGWSSLEELSDAFGKKHIGSGKDE